MKGIRLCLILSTAAFCLAGSAETAWAQIQLLPKGIGAVQYSHRTFGAIDEEYDANGHKVSLAKPFEKEFSGQKLLTGEGGDELQSLAAALRDYDAQVDGTGSLVDALQLGQLRGSVEADVQAQVFGFAYGISNKLSIYLAAPYIQASTNARLYLEGANTAAEIKSRLGGLAFQELQEGLSRAEALSMRDIEGTISEAGYAPLGRWSDQGFGDLRIGTRTAWNARAVGPWRYGVGVDTRLTIPTGRTDDPAQLADIAFGTGYYTTTAGITQRVSFLRRLYAETDLSYGYNVNAKTKRRVPENGEALVAAERTYTVELDPGDDTEASLGVGADYAGFGAGARLGRTRHFGDRYSGSLAGDYATLSAGSDTEEIYQEFSLSFDTTEAYKKRRFAIPFIAAAVMHQPLASRNLPENTYYELRLTSFFAAPTQGKPRR